MDRVKLSADTATTKKQITLYEKKKYLSAVGMQEWYLL